MSADGLVVVLGGGGARGLAHAGVLEVLEQRGIPVRAVVGTSIGAEVGAFFSSGFPMAEVCRIGSTVDWRRTLRLFMPDRASGGLCSGRRILEFLQTHFGDQLIENLPVPWVGIATDLDSGEEVILDTGPLALAARASLSIPGLLAPFPINGRLLIDGGVVNPLPIDVARARFGGPVLAVSLQSLASGSRRPLRPQRRGWLRASRALRSTWRRVAARAPSQTPAAFDDMDWRVRWVMSRTAGITQAALVRLRLQQAPPDLLLHPDVGHIGPLEFYRGAEAIEAGRREVLQRLPEIERILASGYPSMTERSGSSSRPPS
ncbi:MAG: patatin-like phospholipase family protein [Acidiferrobacteraceae bacterium]